VSQGLIALLGQQLLAASHRWEAAGTTSTGRVGEKRMSQSYLFASGSTVVSAATLTAEQASEAAFRFVAQ